MNPKTLTYHLCKIVKLAGKPVNHHYILGKLEDQGYEINSRNMVEVTMLNSGLFNRSHEISQCCGKRMTLFSMTDEAKMKLAEVERGQVPLSKSEWESFGIMVSEGG